MSGNQAHRAEALRRAERCVADGNCEAAIAVYRGLIETDPLDLDSIQALGDLYVSTGRTHEGLHELARLADRRIALGPAIHAVPLLKQMLDLDPASAAAQMKLAVVYARSGKPEQAQQAFLAAASAFATKGNLVRATEAVRSALALNPNSPQARATLKALEAQTSPYVVQLPNADAAPPAAPKPRDGKELAELGRKLSEAAADFSSGDLTSEVIVRQLFAAELLAGCDETAKAIAILKRILGYRPDAIDVRTKLGDIYLRSGMMCEASQEFLEIAHIYERRGEAARAGDYRVRAERIGQQLGEAAAQASGPAADLPQGTSGDDIQVSEAGRPTGDAPAAIAAAGAARTASETATTEPVRRTGHTPLGLLDAAPPAVIRRRPPRRRFVFYAVAAAVVIALLSGWYEARRHYAAEMDRAYQTLARANNLPGQLPVATVEQFSLPRSEEQMDVRAESPSSARAADETRATHEPAASEESARPDGAHKEPAPAPAVIPKAASDAAAAPTSPKPVAPPAVSTLESPTKAAGPPPDLPVNPPPVANSNPPPPVAARPAAVIVKGEAIHRTQPVYPARARAAHQSGAVLVEVDINERGEVFGARILSGPTLLRDAAVEAARRWKFKAATRDGKPIASVSTITFNFRM